MDTFIKKLIADKPYKLILSNKASKENEFNKVVITKKVIKNTPMYQIEKFTNTQAFHININEADLENILNEYLNVISITHSAYSKLNKNICQCNKTTSK